MTDYDPIAFRCPSCGARPGWKCWYTSERRQLVEWFHATRERLALLPKDDPERIRFSKRAKPRGLGKLPPATSFQHGTHARYVAGCRCSDCRRGHSDYAKLRYRAQKLRGDWNGLVDAARARRHILKLSRAGVGRRSIYAACDVSLTVLEDVKSGVKKRIRARTEKRILAVDKTAIADASPVPASKTWDLIGRLIKEGFSKAEIARRLGMKKPGLQFRKDRILARNALKVEKLYRLVMTG